MQLSKSLLLRIRGAANGKTERAAGARVRRKRIGDLSGVSPQAARSGEKRAPKTSIQDGKKGIRGLLIVFMEIRAVTGFSGEMDAERSARFPGALAE
jgi:hypothetical protein